MAEMNGVGKSAQCQLPSWNEVVISQPQEDILAFFLNSQFVWMDAITCPRWYSRYYTCWLKGPLG